MKRGKYHVMQPTESRNTIYLSTKVFHLDADYSRSISQTTLNDL